MQTKKFILNFFLLFVSTSVSLLSISLVLEILLPTRQTKIEMILRKKRLEIDYPLKIKSATNGFFPLYYPLKTREHFLRSRYYPAGTLAHTQTFYCNEGYGLISFKSDRFGLRNDEEDWDEIRNKGATFFIGDSFTQGACVEKEFVVTELFSNLLNENALNLGSAGNGPYEYVALLKNVVKPIISSNLGKETSTILLFYNNDNVRLEETLDQHLSSSQPIAEVNLNGFINVSKEYLSTLNETITKHYPTNSRDILDELKSNRERSTAYRVLTLYPLRSIIKKQRNTKKSSLSTNPSIKAISELHSICNPKTLCTPYVVYIPNSNYWDPTNEAGNEYKLLLEKTSNSLSIEFLDSSSSINPNEKSNYAPIGPHLSKEGYRKLANFIASKVNQK